MARLLGIDATKTSVRIAVIRTSYRRITLEALAEAHVGDGGEAAAIRAAAGTLKPDAAAIALSGERSFYRRLDLPAAAQKELENVLTFELESTVPFEMSEVVFDHAVLKRAQGSTSIPVFAALARIEDVRARIDVVRTALGIEPERVGTGSLPLANLASVIPELEGKTPGPIAIVDLGELQTEVLVMQGGEAVFARTLSRGTIGLPESAPALARELRQTTGAFRSAGGDPIEHVYLAGWGASATGAADFLSDQLGIPVAPLPAPKLEGLGAEHSEKIHRFTKALGLALGLAGRARGLDLRTGPLEAERSYPFLREKIPTFAGLGAAMLVSFGFALVAELRTLDSENEMLTARLQATSRDVLGEETSDPARARELLEQGPGNEDDPMPRVDAFDVMVQLSKAVPKDVVHDVLDFDVSRGHVVLQGTVPKVNDAETIASAMKENHCFKDVKVPRNNQLSDKQKYVLEFDLKCEVPKKKKTGAAEPADSASAAPVKEGR
jgi:general secretion pathway protein L